MARWQWLKALILVLLNTLFLSACSLIAISDKVAYEDSEGPIPESLLRDIKQDTSKDWLVSQFGEPLRIDSGPSRQEIYTYQFTRQHKRYADFILILRYRGLERNTEYLHVLMQNHKVTKHWIDRHEYVQLEGVWQREEKSESIVEDSTAEKSNTIPPTITKTPGVAI